MAGLVLPLFPGYAGGACRGSYEENSYAGKQQGTEQHPPDAGMPSGAPVAC